jgi:hypothetical protein
LHPRLGAQRLELLLCLLAAEARLVVGGAGHGAAVDDLRRALVGRFGELDRGLLGADVALDALVVHLRRLQCEDGLLELGLGAVHRVPEGGGVEPEQQLPGPHLLPLVDRDVLHDAGYVGGNQQLVGLDVGVVGGGVTPALQPVPAAADGQGQHAGQHQGRAQPAPAARRGSGRRLG